MEFYRYIYYKIYKAFEPMGCWPKFRALAFLLVLEILFLGSILNYFSIVTGIFFNLPENDLWAFLIILGIASFNSWTIDEVGQKKLIKKFDKLPRKKNFRGTLIVWGGILLVMFFFYHSMFLYDRLRP